MTVEKKVDTFEHEECHQDFPAAAGSADTAKPAPAAASSSAAAAASGSADQAEPAPAAASSSAAAKEPAAVTQPGDDPDKLAKLAASIHSVPIFVDCDPAFVESCSKLVRQMS